MTLIPFMPPPGLVSDDTTFKAEGRWADGRNVRFVNGSPQVIGEYVELFDLGSEVVYGMFAIDRSGTTHIAYGTGSKVYVGSGVASPTERTPASMGSGYTAYAFAAWGDQILFVPSGKTLYEQTGTSTATEITNAPNKITWMLVTPQRQVLAFGCNEESSGTFNGRCIRGSDLEDYTDWTTSATNNAFEHILDGSGQIVTARLIGQYIAVWTDTALHLGQFIGDPSQTYRFDRVAENCGAVWSNAVAIVGQRAYWIGNDARLRTWAPGGEVEIIPCPLQNRLVTSGNPRNGTVLVHVPKFNELWIIPNGGIFGFMVNLTDGTWWRSDFATFNSDSADRPAFLCDDLIARATNSTQNTNLLGANGDGKVFAHECGLDQTASGPKSWYLQSADQYLDNSQRRMMVRGVQPDFSYYDTNADAWETNNQSVSLTLTVRDRQQSTATTKGPYTITAGATKKDFRASGKIVTVKLSQTTNVDREMRIGKLLFDVVPLGER
jgi:hypothetical protein